MTRERISKGEFFATIGQLDVIPHLEGNYDYEMNGYKTIWRLRRGDIVGESLGSNYYRITKDADETGV